MPITSPLNILFVCTGNSCRSQMAEGYTKLLSSGMLNVDSAGLEAHGMNKNAVKVMQEDSVDISGQESKILTPDQIKLADIIITVCGHADKHCPVLPPKVLRCHWPFDDPASLTGDENTVLIGFRQVRNRIKSRVQEFIDGLELEQPVRVSHM